MINFEVLKKKAQDAVETIAEKSVDIYNTAEAKAKKVAKQAKLASEISKYNSDIKKLYAELGMAFYNMNKEEPDDAYAQLFAEIAFVAEQLEIKQNEYDALDSETEDEIPVEEVVAETDEPEVVDAEIVEESEPSADEAEPTE